MNEFNLAGVFFPRLQEPVAPEKAIIRTYKIMLAHSGRHWTSLSAYSRIYHRKVDCPAGNKDAHERT